MKLFARPHIVDGETSELKFELVPVKCDGLWGFVDKSGKEVIKCKYDHVGTFISLKSAYLAPVQFNGQWGLIDHTGKEIVKCHYSSIEALYEGIEPVHRYL